MKSCKECNKKISNQSKSGLCLSCVKLKKYLSKDTIQKKSKAQKNKKMSQNTKEKISKKLKNRNPWNKGLTSEIDSRVKSGYENGMYGKHRSKELKEHLSNVRSEAIANGSFNLNTVSRGKKGWYFSLKNNEKFYYDSLLELYMMHILDDDKEILKWTKRHGIKIPYQYKGEKRNFVPDFLIETKKEIILKELKGISNKKEKLKKESMQKYCKKNNLVFSWVMQKDIENSYRKFIKELK